MRPPKSLAQNGDSGQGRGNGKRGSFGETTDNSFRNYMSRKIELQRKQFGLVLPPPPQPPLPPEILKEQARNSNVPTPQFAKKSPTDQLLHQSEKKSVRFHENSEKSVSKQNSSATSASASAQSISEVLNQLKQRHTKKSKKHGTNSKKKSRLSSDHRRRNSSSQDMDKTSDEQTLTYDALNKSLSLDDTNAEHKNNQPGAECTSVLGVLDKLQKRHGTSGSKRKRTSKVSFSPILKRTKDNFDGVGLVAPTLQTQENYDSPCLNNLDASKRKREGYRCQGKSVLEGLQNIQTNEGTEKYSKKTKASVETKAKYKLSANSPISPIGISCDSPKFSFEDLDAIDENYTLETDCISNSFFPELLQQAPTTPVQPSRNQMLAQFTQFSPAIDSPSAHSTEEMPSNLASRRTTNPRPDLFFTGIVILVNGHTSPDATTLMRLLHKHGGDLEKYETRRVTHIIAERLSTAKVNIYKRQKKPTPVCRPEWISDSVDKGKLLPHADYLVEDVKGGDDFGTKSVKSFFTSKQGDERASIDIHCHNRRVSERQDIDDECKQNSAEAKKASLLESRGDGSFSSNDQHEPRVASFKSRDISPLKGGSDSKSGICPATDLTVFENPSPHHHPSAHRWHDKNPSSSNYVLNGNVRTVSNDPTFLESYFSNSRLSYIGSFKQRVKSVGNTASRSRSKSGAERFVLLVDMDCFFASVALKNYPEHRNKPVAVGHSGSNKSGNEDQRSFASRSKNSSCELSTCNYIARKYGIRKGMFLGDAIELCPDLVVLPYDFNGFEEVSSTVAERLHHYADQYDGCVEQVSCDEAYVEIYLSPDDFPGSDVYEFVHSLAERIRKDIFDQTDCTASIGVGTNKLLAKLAADKVKPDACCVVKDWKVFLGGLNLRDIPGIGRKFQRKLEPHSLDSVNDIWDLGDDASRVLGEIIGQGNAKRIVRFCYGKDDRSVTPAVRKTIGAECNYGVRFDGPYGVDCMMSGLSKEVQKRMTLAGVRGSKIILKIMRSKDTSKIPGKFLGHGSCDSISRSADIQLTRDSDIISAAGMKLYERLGVDKHSVRGMGIVISSLKQDDAADSSHSSPSKLSAWLGKDKTKSSTSWNSEASVSNCEVLFDQSNSGKRVSFAVQKSNRYEDDVETANLTALNLPTSDASSNSMPTFSQLDEDVLRELPNNILNDVKLMYQRDQRGGSISQGKASDRTNVSVPMPGSVSILHGGADKVDSPRRDSALLNDGGTFFVPSMSQIDIDEVMELPPSIREEILHQIGKRGDNAKKNDYIVQSTNQASSKTKRACLSKKEDKSILVAGQVSVKRMLKLASIKTGKEQCCSFPLSQLSCLPLETQLQIANSDDIKIAKKVHKKFVACDHEARVLSNQHISSVDHENESSSDSILDDNPHTTHYTGDSPKVFFQENIAPLKDFISSNPNPGSAEVSAVKEFLSLCVHEKRYDDSVTLLRAIKNMKNGWNSAIYNQLRTATGDEIFASSGSRLDLAWLGL